MTTKERILIAAHEILATGGGDALSFDAIARALGLSKQAVLYWFPSKPDLLAALFVPSVQAEADAALSALQGTIRPEEAIAVFVRAIIAFHLGHLDRFRMMYLVPQTMKGTGDTADRAILPLIHAASDRLYGALAERLGPPAPETRQQAVAVHSACLGLLLMLGLAQGTGDQLKHRTEDLVEALITRLGGGAGGAP